MNRRPATVAQIAARVSTPDEFAAAWREFLDRFYLEPGAASLIERPRLLRPVLDDEGYADAFLGAMAAELARRHRFAVPEWTVKPERHMTDPVFALESRKNWAVLLQDSPAEFRARRLFVTANVLDRA